MKKKSKLPIFIGCLAGYIFTVYLLSLYYAQYLITEDYIQALNNLKSTALSVGQKLIIPQK